MIFAISAKPSAIPPKPKTAATRAIIKKITIRRIIIVVFLISYRLNYSRSHRAAKDYYYFNSSNVNDS